MDPVGIRTRLSDFLFRTNIHYTTTFSNQHLSHKHPLQRTWCQSTGVILLPLHQECVPCGIASRKNVDWEFQTDYNLEQSRWEPWRKNIHYHWPRKKYSNLSVLLEVKIVRTSDRMIRQFREIRYCTILDRMK